MNLKGRNINKLNIAQFAIIIALVVFIVLMLTANNTKDVDMETFRTALASDEEVAKMSERSEAELSAGLGVDLSGTECLGFEADDVMDVSRLYIFKTDDDSKMQEIIDSIDRQIESDSKDFDGYGTNQYDLLQAAVRLKKGKYYFAAVSEDAQKWEDEFLKLVK